jgi:hypothetical protein
VASPHHPRQAGAAASLEWRPRPPHAWLAHLLEPGRPCSGLPYLRPSARCPATPRGHGPPSEPVQALDQGHILAGRRGQRLALPTSYGGTNADIALPHTHPPPCESPSHASSRRWRLGVVEHTPGTASDHQPPRRTTPPQATRALPGMRVVRHGERHPRSRAYHSKGPRWEGERRPFATVAPTLSRT